MKKIIFKRYNPGFISLLGILLSLVIICALVYMLFKAYFKRPLLNKEVNKTISESGIDTSNYQSVVDSTRKSVEDIQNQHMQNLKKLEEIQ